jgi:hypothetical protein
MARARRKSAANVNFSDYNEVLRWFDGEVAATLAARVALRVIPHVVPSRKLPRLPSFRDQPRKVPVLNKRLLVSAKRTTELLDAVLLPTLHAGVAAWAIARHPVRRNDLTAAARGAAAAAAAGATLTASDSANAARSVARAASAAAISDTNFATAAAAVRDAVAVAFPIAAVMRSDALAIDGGRTAVALAGDPLWPGGVPEWAGSAWAELRDLLSAAGDDWDFWIGWYEDRLTGRSSLGEEFDIAMATLPDELWKRGPKAVNARIRELIAEHTAPAPIPPQGAGPHFQLNLNLRIALALPSEIDADGNNLSRINNLLPIVRQAASDLAAHLNPNTHPEISRTLKDYRDAIAGGPPAIPWGIAWGLGVRLENAASATRRRIEDRLEPPLEDAAQEALDTFMTLHGPLILATKEGQDLTKQAVEFRLREDQRSQLREDADAIARAVISASDLIEPSAAPVIAAAAEATDDGPHPERGAAYWAATVRNIAVILIPAAMLGSVGAVAGAYLGASVGGAAGAGLGAVAGLTLRESERAKVAAKALGAEYDHLLNRGGAAMVAGLRRLTPFRRLVIAIEQPLRRYAETTQSRWMLRYIDFIVRTNPTQE